MNPKLIIQARIDELQSDMDKVITELKELQRPSGASMASMKVNFELISKHKDQVLGLRSAIAELKNIKELV
jgi:hypothetical protein